MPDHGQKTEKASPKRIDKARKKGRFAVSRDFIGGIQFLAFVAILGMMGREWWAGLEQTTVMLFDRAFASTLTISSLTHLTIGIAMRTLLPLLQAGAAMAGIVLAIQLAVTRFGFSPKKLAPDLKKLNPIARLRDLPRQNAPEFLKALLLAPVFGGAVYAVAGDHLREFLTLPARSVEAGIAVLGRSVSGLFWKASGVFLVFGIVDLLRQQRKLRGELMMTKQEVREEAKESDGNPQVKMRIRRLRRELLRRRMMREVPTATTVIVNPTHYAVAIRYEMGSQAAPRVVAKGKNYLAQRIRQLALDHQVPLVENPLVAQALYKSVEVGQEIPAHLYRAVAEILAYIYRLMRR